MKVLRQHKKVATIVIDGQPQFEAIGGRWGGAGFFFLHANAHHSKPKVASRCRHAANIAFDLFNIFLYVIACKVQKCPLSPFMTSNIVLSWLV